MTTNLDLVEWQLRVAAGEALPLTQDEITRDGHAIEVRLYAENPRKDFLPSVGKLAAFVTPEEDAHFRLDTGVEAGDEITIHYDPMIAKLVVWHEDRASAISTLKQALSDTAVFGLTTNLPLLRCIVADDVFAAGDIDTRYIDTHLAELNRAEPAPDDVLDAAALDYLLENEEVSGFALADGFQANALGGRRFVFRDESEHETTRFVRSEAKHFVIREGNASRNVTAEQIDAFTLRVANGGRSGSFTVLRLDDAVQVSSAGNTWQLARVHPFAAKSGGSADESHPGAPMPGRIVAVHVKAGDRVEQGQPLVVMEGMKMEVTVKAGVAGVIEKVLYAEGDQVEADAPLVDIRTDK